MEKKRKAQPKLCTTLQEFSNKFDRLDAEALAIFGKKMEKENLSNMHCPSSIDFAPGTESRTEKPLDEPSLQRERVRDAP